MGIAHNIACIRAAITEACQAAGREPSSVVLVAVTKTVEPARIALAVQAGLRDLGENWVQEAALKKPQVERLSGSIPLRWHMVGHLQTNKVRRALETFDLIQSVDSLRLAQELNRRLAQSNSDARQLPVLIEVNTSGEPGKYGVAPDRVRALAAELLKLRHLRLEGLMTIGPGLSVTEPERSRPCFRGLRELRDKLAQEFGLSLPWLSMGMTSDFRVAIQEGATMLRIGTAIFGAREQVPKV